LPIKAWIEEKYEINTQDTSPPIHAAS